jgi:hypothetical protein
MELEVEPTIRSSVVCGRQNTTCARRGALSPGGINDVFEPEKNGRDGRRLMYSRQELAEVQRSSHIFSEDDPNTIRSPNYKRNDRTNAYRYALQQQIEADEDQKRRERMISEEHPLEMKVQRYQLKHKSLEEEEDQTFQIGTRDNRTTEERRSAQASYRAQLQADSSRFKEMVQVDEAHAGRKPYSRRPVSPSDTFNIGKDEAATKLQKKKESNEFYREEMLRNPATSKTRHRPSEESQDSAPAFAIGRDDRELKALKALQQQEYRDALDEQKAINNQRKSSQLQNERYEDRLSVANKLPYSQH